VICLAPRAPGDSVRPRRLAGASVRPLNFTVRGRAKTRLETHEDLRSEVQDSSFGTIECAPMRRGTCDLAASGGFGLRAGVCGAHSAFDERAL